MTKAEYKHNWRCRKYALIPTKPCGCGCGARIPERTIEGTARRFVNGHHSRGIKTGRPSWNRITDKPLSPYERHRRYLVKKRATGGTQLCACGCRTEIYALTAQCLPARYVIGHNPDGFQTRFQHGHKTWNKGKPHPTQRQGNRTSCARAGFRQDLNQFFRSRWEANYARYLCSTGSTYTYEPACYLITLPDGSQHAYRPDFLVDSCRFVEIKGWVFRNPMTPAILHAAASQLPHPLTVIGPAEYAVLEAQWSHLDLWEHSKDKRSLIRPDRQCEYCGSSYAANSESRKYCSAACAGRSNGPSLKIIRDIRHLIETGERKIDVARRFGLDWKQIHAIAIGRSWADIM